LAAGNLKSVKDEKQIYYEALREFSLFTPDKIND
jgi:hypothetical protein